MPRSRTISRKKRRTQGRNQPISDRSFEAKNRAFHAVTRMRRDGLSPRDAAREEGTTLATIRKYIPATLRRSKVGHWTVTKSDRYLRILSLPGPTTA